MIQSALDPPHSFYPEDVVEWLPSMSLGYSLLKVDH